jgi:Cu+-exporting ATPase
LKTDNFDIKGMTCSACVAHVEKSVGKLQGMNAVQVNLLSNSMTVTYDEKSVSVSDISASVFNAGYQAALQLSKNSGNNTATEEMQKLGKQWWLS